MWWLRLPLFFFFFFLNFYRDNNHNGLLIVLIWRVSIIFSMCLPSFPCNCSLVTIHNKLRIIVKNQPYFSRDGKYFPSLLSSNLPYCSQHKGQPILFYGKSTFYNSNIVCSLWQKTLIVLYFEVFGCLLSLSLSLSLK